MNDDGFDRQIQKDFKKLAKHISKHPFVQNKEQFEGYTVFELEGVKFITLLDAKIIIGKALSKALTAEEAKRIFINLTKLKGRVKTDPMGFGQMRSIAIEDCIKVIEEAFKKKGVDL